MSPSYEKVFKELEPAGSVVYKTDLNTQRVVSIGTNTIHENEKDEALRSIDIIIANELSPKGNCNTPRIVSSIYSARVIEVGKEKADEEIRIVEQLVNDNKEFQVMCNSLYDEMIASAKKKVKNGKIPGLTDKNGRTLDAHEFAVDVAYAALDRIRVNEDVQDLAVLANQSITGESTDVRNAAFAELLKKSYAIESERNEQIVNANASEYVNLKNRRALSRGYDLESANTRPTFISEVAKATAKSFSGSGNVFTHNTRISATIILRKPVIRILMEDYTPANHEAGESVKVEESNTELNIATPPAADTPPVEEPKPEGEKKKKAPNTLESIIDQVSEVLLGGGVIAAAVIARSKLDELLKARNGEEESKFQRSVRFILSNGVLIAVPVASYFAYTSLKKKTQENEQTDTIRRNLVRILTGLGIASAAAYAVNRGVEYYRGRQHQESRSHEYTPQSEVRTEQTHQQAPESEPSISDSARVGMERFIEQVRETLVSLGFTEFDDPREVNVGKSRLLQTLIGFRDRADERNRFAGRIDDLTSLANSALMFLTSASKVLGIENPEVVKLISIVEQITKRVDTAAETSETEARVTKAMTNFLIQLFNPERTNAEMIGQFAKAVFDAISKPHEKEEKNDGEGKQSPKTDQDSELEKILRERLTTNGITAESLEGLSLDQLLNMIMGGSKG